MILGLVAAFAVAALLLASIALYGVMSYAVVTGRRELGIRMALGAKRRQIVSGVLRGGLKLTTTGLVIGLPTALATARVLSSELDHVHGRRSVAISGTAVTVMVVALLATLIPALRAARLDPATAVKSD